MKEKSTSYNHDGLTAASIPILPDDWCVMRLGELCGGTDGAIQTGPFGSQLHASDYVEHGVPIVNPTHMAFGGIVNSGIPRVSRSDAERLARHILRVGDILFSRRGDVGRHALVTENEAGWLCGTGSLLIRTSSADVHPAYLSAYLDSPVAQEFLATNAAGTIMPNINTKILSAVPVALPPLSEQVRIATLVRMLAGRYAIARKTAEVYRSFIEAALPPLMSGAIRTTEE